MTSEKIVKIIQYLIFVVVLLVPLIYFPTGIYPFQIIKIVVFQILAEIIFVLFLILAISDKEYRPKLTPLTAIILVFLLILSLSVVFGADWRTGLWTDESRTMGLIAIWHFFVFFLAVSSLGEKINWRKIWQLSFFAAVMISVIGISQKFIVLPKGSSEWFYILYSAIPQRIGSVFGNSAFMAGYLLPNFFIGLWLLVWQRAKGKGQIANSPPSFRQRRNFGETNKWQIAVGAGIILIFAAIFLSQTLGVILGLTAGIFVLLFYFSICGHHQSLSLPIFQKLNLQKLSISLLILILIFNGIFWFTRGAPFWQKIPGLARIAQASLEKGSIRDRLITWQISLRAFKDKPWLGWGFENFRIPFNKYYDPGLLPNGMSGTYWDKPHNVLLEHLTNSGIFALLAYSGIFIIAFKMLIDIDKKSAGEDDSAKINQIQFQSALNPFFAALFISYFVQNLFLFDTIGTYLMFFVVLAFINAQIKTDWRGFARFVKTGGPLPAAVEKYKPSKTAVINQNLASLPAIAFFLLILSVPLYCNFQIFQNSRYEYWGINYFLNQLPEKSLAAFNQGLHSFSPYIDDIRRSFADMVRQGFQQNIPYSFIEEIQKQAAEELRTIIKRHPEDFFHYITLAKFENVFYQFDEKYLEESENLCQEAFVLSPKRQEIYYVLAKTKLLKGDIGAAKQLFQEVIELNPESAGPHFYFGLMAYGLDDAKTGAAEIAEAERLGFIPQTPEELIALGNFIGDYEHNYKKAIGYYQKAFDVYNSFLRPDPLLKSNVLLKLALAYYFNGNKLEARQKFLDLIQNDIKFETLPLYQEIKPILDELGIKENRK